MFAGLVLRVPCQPPVSPRRAHPRRMPARAARHPGGRPRRRDRRGPVAGLRHLPALRGARPSGRGRQSPDLASGGRVRRARAAGGTGPAGCGPRAPGRLGRRGPRESRLLVVAAGARPLRESGDRGAELVGTGRRGSAARRPCPVRTGFRGAGGPVVVFLRPHFGCGDDHRLPESPHAVGCPGGRRRRRLPGGGRGQRGRRDPVRAGGGAPRGTTGVPAGAGRGVPPPREPVPPGPAGPSVRSPDGGPRRVARSGRRPGGRVPGFRQWRRRRARPFPVRGRGDRYRGGSVDALRRDRGLRGRRVRAGRGVRAPGQPPLRGAAARLEGARPLGPGAPRGLGFRRVRVRGSRHPARGPGAAVRGKPGGGRADRPGRVPVRRPRGSLR